MWDLDRKGKTKKKTHCFHAAEPFSYILTPRWLLRPLFSPGHNWTGLGKIEGEKQSHNYNHGHSRGRPQPRTGPHPRQPWAWTYNTPAITARPHLQRRKQLRSWPTKRRERTRNKSEREEKRSRSKQIDLLFSNRLDCVEAVAFSNPGDAKKWEEAAKKTLWQVVRPEEVEVFANDCGWRPRSWLLP